MKFGMGVMPLGSTLKLYFLISYFGDTNMVGERTSEVDSTLAPLTLGSYSDVR
jgi:hypothetical protein